MITARDLELRISMHICNVTVARSAKIILMDTKAEAHFHHYSIVKFIN